MVGEHGCEVGGQNEHPDEESRRMDAAAQSIRRAHVRRLVRDGLVPADRQVSADGTRLEPVEGAWWPVTPFDQPCRGTWPQLDVLERIRKVVPDFDPETDKWAWAVIGEYILRTGRSLEDVRQMTLDQIGAFFQFEAKRVASGGTSHDDTAVSSEVASASNPAAVEMRVRKGETVLQALVRIMAHKDGLLRLLDAGSAKDIALLLGRSATAVKEAKPAWTILKQRLKARRVEERVEQEQQRSRS